MSTEETSEFSVNELLYMGSVSLTITVDIYIDPATRDPFDIVAEREEHDKVPLAVHAFFRRKENPM